ncbi:MAG TPA: type II secretion system protein [Bacilli bacterium]|nr:type II secretion system protein [Bacilli bacterium]
MKKILNDQAFTLIEIMLVLQIIAILSTVVIASFRPMIRELQNERFIAQLIEDIYYAQQFSLANGDITHVTFLPNKYTYDVATSTKLIYSRSYDKHIEIASNTLSINDLRFLTNGNAYKSGTISIYIDGHPYFLRILLGKGRFYVEKV